MSIRTLLRIVLCVAALAATQGSVRAVSPRPQATLEISSLPSAWSFATNQVGSRLGAAVATAGDVNGDGHPDLLIAAPNGTDPSTTTTSEGVVFVFYGTPSGMYRDDGIADQVLSQGTNGALFGASVAGAVDMNNDGYDDVLIGAPGYKPGDPTGQFGAVFLYYGSEDGLGDTPDWAYVGDKKEAEFGASVDFAGDVDNDGYDDIVVGAPLYWDQPETEVGAAFVIRGAASNPITTTVQMLMVNQVDARYGASVSAAGDINGDGFDDIAVGAPNYRDPLWNEGAAFVHLGTSAGISTTVAWQDSGGQEGANYGWAVGAIGDVNNDGLTDIAVGAPFYDDLHLDQGLVRIFYGSLQGLGTAPDWSFIMPQAFARFGAALAPAGDMNGDGVADLVIGAPSYTNEYDDPSNDLSEPVLVFLGSAGGLGGYWAWRIEEGQAITDFGWAVGTAGDVNGDGLDDIVVGAPQTKAGGQKVGKAFLYLGTAAAPMPYAIFLPLILRAAP